MAMTKKHHIQLSRGEAFTVEHFNDGSVYVASDYTSFPLATAMDARKLSQAINPVGNVKPVYVLKSWANAYATFGAVVGNEGDWADRLLWTDHQREATRFASKKVAKAALMACHSAAEARVVRLK